MTGQDRDDESGEFTPSYSAEQFLAALETLGGAAGTREIADEVGCHRETARRWLNDLEEGGDITRQTVGDAALWVRSNE